VGLVGLREIVEQLQELEICCLACHSRTGIDSAFFLARRGDMDLGDLARRLVCPACGSADIRLLAVRNRDEVSAR
jgi:hypothetical protein